MNLLDNSVPQPTDRNIVDISKHAKLYSFLLYMYTIIFIAPNTNAVICSVYRGFIT